MGWVGKRVMSTPTSAMMTSAVVAPTQGISSRRATAGAKGAMFCLYLGFDVGDVRVQGVDAGEHLGQQKTVVLSEVPDGRLCALHVF